MKTFSALRQVDHREANVASICTQLKNQGYLPELSRPLPGARYLRFHGQFEDHADITGLILLGDWAKKTLPELDGIDWLSMEDVILQSLIQENPLKLALSHQHAPFRKMKATELVVGAIEKGTALDFACLEASPGRVMIERYTSHLHQDASEMAALADLPIPVTFSVGYSVLPCDALHTIEVGDVVLVEHMEGRVSCNGKSLFTCELNHETIMILENNENPQHDIPDTEPKAASGATGLNSLPVELSFVLLEKFVPLNELKAITPGEVVELPRSAMQEVEIRANKRTIARGELVQLANGQLGVEIRTLWPQGQ